MRSLLKVWLFMLAGAGIGVVLTQDSGYVLMSFRNYTVEMSLALLLLGLAALFTAMYFGIRVLVRTLRAAGAEVKNSRSSPKVVPFAFSSLGRTTRKSR